MRSPVWRTNAGGVGSALILAMASRSVAVTSGFAALLKPMWLSLIWTKLRSAFRCSTSGSCSCRLAQLRVAQPLAAGDQLHAAEDQVEGARPVRVGGVGMGVERAAARSGSPRRRRSRCRARPGPRAERSLVLGREVRLVGGRAGDLERLAEVDHRDLVGTTGSRHAEQLDGVGRVLGIAATMPARRRAARGSRRGGRR